jgi:predicted transcriptional regulator
MRSVADDLRREQREKILAMTPAQRIALVESMLEEGLALYAAGQQVTREEAIRQIRASRQRGRRFSRCMTSE